MNVQQLTAIRAKCIEANPDNVCWGLPSGGNIKDARSPRLADVLLAIGTAENNALRPFPRDVAVDGRGIISSYFSLTDKRSESWNLRNDDLSAQSDECVQFLCELLR